MTIPHMMNCAHLDDGWCLDCVQGLNADCDEWQALAEKVVEAAWKRCTCLPSGSPDIDTEPCAKCSALAAYQEKVGKP